MTFEMEMLANMDEMATRCHERSYKSGWWHHPETGLPYIPGDSTRDNKKWSEINVNTREMIIAYWPMVVACKMSLIHSEVAEATEAHRTDAMDSHLPDHLGVTTEFADAMLRQFDLIGAMSRAAKYKIVDPMTHTTSIGAAIFDKIAYNAARADHKPAVRNRKGGKKY